MKFGIFYEHQLPRPWDNDAEEKLLNDALVQVELRIRSGSTTSGKSNTTFWRSTAIPAHRRYSWRRPASAPRTSGSDTASFRPLRCSTIRPELLNVWPRWISFPVAESISVPAKRRPVWSSAVSTFLLIRNANNGGKGWKQSFAALPKIRSPGSMASGFRCRHATYYRNRSKSRTCRCGLRVPVARRSSTPRAKDWAR